MDPKNAQQGCSCGIPHGVQQLAPYGYPAPAFSSSSGHSNIAAPSQGLAADYGYAVAPKQAVEAPRPTTAMLAEDTFYTTNRVNARARRLQEWLHHIGDGNCSDPAQVKPTTLEEWQHFTLQITQETENILNKVLDRLGIEF